MSINRDNAILAEDFDLHQKVFCALAFYLSRFEAYQNDVDLVNDKLLSDGI